MKGHPHNVPLSYVAFHSDELADEFREILDLESIFGDLVPSGDVVANALTTISGDPITTIAGDTITVI